MCVSWPSSFLFSSYDDLVATKEDGASTSQVLERLWSKKLPWAFGISVSEALNSLYHTMTTLSLQLPLIMDDKHIVCGYVRDSFSVCLCAMWCGVFVGGETKISRLEMKLEEKLCSTESTTRHPLDRLRSFYAK